MQACPRAYTVIVALVQDKSPIFAGLQTKNTTASAPTEVGASTTTAAQPPARPAQDTANQEAAETSQRAIEAERQRIAKVRAEEQQLEMKRNLAKCKPDDDQCRRMAWQ
jgi:hypothetical protein